MGVALYRPFGAWLMAWGGPMCGEQVWFPAGQDILPVWRLKTDPPMMLTVGEWVGDWQGLLLGHYFADGKKARWMEPRRAKPRLGPRR